MPKLWSQKFKGNFMIAGMSVFDYTWINTGITVTLPHPDYFDQTYDYDVYTIDVNGISKQFAHREFGIGKDAFYVEEE